MEDDGGSEMNEITGRERVVLDEIMQVINQEIQWCYQNPDEELSADYQVGFIKGLEQAKYFLLAVAMRKGAAGNFITEADILGWEGK
jgi:hypothetical protein